jgi:putative transposase
LEQALIIRITTLRRVGSPFQLRSDDGRVSASRHFTHRTKCCGLEQKFITPRCSQQKRLIERAIRTLKEQFVHCRHFKTQHHAMRIIADWFETYNDRHKRRAFGIKVAAEA